MNTTINPCQTITGTITVPGDKSISHRSVMFSALAQGTTTISGFLTGADCLATIDCFRKMGISISQNGTNVTVEGKGLHGLQPPAEMLDVGNSGTTIRLMMGLLAAQPFETVITGDSSIQKRPMDRVLTPLRQMGADVAGRDGRGLAPITIQGKELTGITYTLPVASAQVKSAILLASLYAKGDTVVIEPVPTRDHTENMLNYLGGNIRKENNSVISSPVGQLTARNIAVPGDISSAAYFIAAGLILKNGSITIGNVGLNPTRTGILTAFKAMGAKIEIRNEKSDYGEKTGDIHVEGSILTGTTISGNIIPAMIDEIPIFAVAAVFAKGRTVIKDAEELKVKESNRIEAMVTELKKMGAHIEETADGMIIDGGFPLRGAKVRSYGDHRIAMSLAIAALQAEGTTEIEDAGCCDVSFPGYFQLLEECCQ